MPEGLATRELERWQAHWIDDEPDDPLVFYCPECAEREFGPSERMRGCG
jgi:hypothetical protein